LISNFIERTNLDDDEIDVTYDEEEIANIGDDPEAQVRFKLARRIWEARWKVQNFDLLPDWLQDNEFLKTGHRPPMPSFTSCFQSIFQLHTETGNIWTHLYGCVAFIGVAGYFLSRPSHMIYWKDKVVFSTFFLGAIFCLGLSFSFHTVQCHSQNVGKLFSK
jgi:adiponectin receptor